MREAASMPLLRWTVRILALACLAGWFLVLRPQSLGGPAAYIGVTGVSMEPGLSAGTLVVVAQQPSYRVGDVVAYRVPHGEPAEGHNVIHRIVGGSAIKGYVMRGDNTDQDDMWQPRPPDVIGRAWLVIPGVGPVLALLRSPMVIASVVAGIATYLVLGLGRRGIAAPTVIRAAPEGSGGPRRWRKGSARQ
jgi:signal peptidase